MNAGIYMILNLVTEMYYIGQAANLNRRWRNHSSMLSNNKHFNILLQRAWNKYGKENFKFYILEFVANKMKLAEREQYWIDRSKCYERHVGYNLRKTAESNLGFKTSDETKIKLSLAGKGRIVSKETRLKLSVSLKGHTINLGRRHSDQTKARMSKAATGRVLSKAARLKISLSKIGRKLSEETRKKISIANTGKTCSEETRLKKSISYKKWFASKNGLGNSIG